MPPAAVALAAAARQALLDAAAAAYPRELVGALGGRRCGDRAVVQSFVALPAAASAAGFAVAPWQFAAAEAGLRARGQCWLGFAHSHPDGAAALSALDRATLWRDCVQLVVGLGAGRAAALAAFCLRGDTALSLPLELLAEAAP